ERRWDRTVRHQSRVLDEAFDPAEAFREREQAAAFQKALGSGQIGLERDGHHAAEGAHLSSRQRVLRMRIEPRIMHAPDFRLALEPLRELERISAMPLHAQRERLETAQREKAVERADDA